MRDEGKSSHLPILPSSKQMEFVHLHCHTQYSLLDGASDIATMMDKAVADGQKGVALTDHGNMFGAFKFVAEANKRNIKPIVGCEFYLVEDRHKKAFLRSRGEEDVRYHQLLLAKNKQGYENLSKLCSLGFMEGLYGKYPRIDKEILVQYHEGLIATSCCIGAEIPQAIMQGKLDVAEEKLRWWLDLFGEDYYIEVQRHRGLENIDNMGVSQEDITQQLLKFAKKYNVKVIATNDSHYVNEEDSQPHDILLCVNTSSLLADEKRFRFSSSDYYFKTQKEMTKLFTDVPHAVDTTMEIYDKIDTLNLTRDVLLPAFPLPPGFTSQDEYLRHLTFEGAKKRYPNITPAIEERLNFELQVIANSGYPGYFLIVQDFTNTARQMGVSVGPGRGSAAGSAVAYCIAITNVDPIKYDLLFERFLNPERVSMPDIDIDFDDVGRQKVIDYVIGKYGRNQVAQIVTYGTMAAKSSLKDVGRVMNIQLAEVDKVTKSFPVHLQATLKKVLAKDDVEAKLKALLNGEELDKAYKFRKLSEGTDEIGQMIRTAKKLEGSIRNTGIHACGVVITPDEITKYVPVKLDKESDMLVTQFDNSVAENAGLLKMDFLGLKTLSIIKDAVTMIQENHDIQLDPDEVPLDDEKTYQLFQRGETVAIFQYESSGMQKYMKELAPTTFEDLIAMNALYRPGPLKYIPNFINRKHGREQITYDLSAMEEYLHDTYGICLAGDSLVFDALTGEQVRIDELENRVGEFYVQGVDENLHSQKAKITHWVCNGRKKVLKIKLRNGSSIKMTSNHKVLTEQGWVEIGKLQVGDYIATPRNLEVENEQVGNRDQLRVLAYLLADGSLSAHGATADFVSKDPALVDAYQESVQTFGNLTTRTLQQVREVTRVMVKNTEREYYHQPNNLVAALREWNLKTTSGGCRSDEKFVPQFVFGLQKKEVAFFLASLWDCDGHINKKFCHFKTISPHLAYDVKTLLLRLGIHSSTCEATYFNNRRSQEMTAYQVTLYDLKAFAKWIAPYLVTKKMFAKEYSGEEFKDTLDRVTFATELKSVWDGSGRGLMTEYGFDRQHLLPTGQNRLRIAVKPVKSLCEKLDLPVTSRNLNVRWDEILEITPAGEELVYDITVEDIHNFIANNIIVHNCVYQEQIMLLSQKLANFTKGQADKLRKAMGKKLKSELDAMYPKFIEGGGKNGHPKKILEKVWSDWEDFASYAFNKSHSTCYAFVAFQTAYLKAHYPAEFMAAVLTHNKTNISDVTFFLQECKRMGLDVLGPDINESGMTFSVNKRGQLRLGMSGLKGVGEGPVEAILAERKKNGAFKNVFDLVRRLPLQAINKRALESLAHGGAFDFVENTHRAQYFAPSEKHDTLIEHALKYGSAYQSQKAFASVSLFGDSQSEVMLAEPAFPQCLQWTLVDKLEKEKEVTGIYISGHPLDDYRVEIENFITCGLDVIDDHKNKPLLQLAGLVVKARHMVSKNGNGWGILEIRDYTGNLEFKLFGEEYQKFKHLLEEGKALFLKGNFKRGWGENAELEFKPTEIKLLEGVGESMTKCITLKVQVEALTPDLIERLENLCTRYEGQHRLCMELVDSTNRIRLNMFSKNRKVLANTDFVMELEKMEVEYRLN